MMTEQIEKSSGNVYKDLDLKDPDELLVKAELASKILSIIEDNGWSQCRAAKELEITQPKISLLNRGQFRGFSIEKLMRLLNRLNNDIEIIVHSKKRKRKSLGKIFVRYSNA